jgi:hypothetical protein
MEINNKQDIADLLDFLDGVNISSIDLPTPSGHRNSWWDELVAYGDTNPGSYIGKSAKSSELLGYRAIVDGNPVTLVILSYSNGGEEGVVLVDGHLETIDDLVDAWLGDTTIDDYKESWDSGNSHAILDYVTIPEEWEVDDNE